MLQALQHRRNKSTPQSQARHLQHLSLHHTGEESPRIGLLFPPPHIQHISTPRVRTLRPLVEKVLLQAVHLAPRLLHNDGQRSLLPQRVA